MKTYHFTAPTTNYGTVHAVVTCDDPDADVFLDADKLALDQNLVERALTPKILKKTTWKLYTVKAFEASIDPKLIKIEDLEPLTKNASILALREMNIRQNEIYEELESLSYASLMEPKKKARLSVKEQYDAIKPSDSEWSQFCNHKTLTVLAIRNPNNILTTQ